MKYGTAIYLSAALGSMVLGGEAAAQDAEEAGEALETVQEIAEDAVPTIPPPPPLRVQAIPTGPYIMSTGIRPADYPAEAWLNGDEGSVGYRLEIDRTGSVTDCAITKSSGSETLDEATCALLFKKAEIAFRGDGRPEPGIVSGTYAWRKREPEMRPMTVAFAYTLTAEGAVEDCEIVAMTGELPERMRRDIERDPCFTTQDRGVPFRDDNGQPVAKRLKLTIDVEELPLQSE